MSDAFTCDKCATCYPADPTNLHTTGYGVDASGQKICFACCAVLDSAAMRTDGKIALYLTESTGAPAKISNWPGTLTFAVVRIRKGRHNVARTRTDAWFRDADGNPWRGVLYGEHTQIIHCKRVAAA